MLCFDKHRSANAWFSKTEISGPWSSRFIPLRGDPASEHRSQKTPALLAYGSPSNIRNRLLSSLTGKVRVKRSATSICEMADPSIPQSSVVQSRRWAIGQLIEKPELPNAAPPGPVSNPSCTKLRIWNSSRNWPRNPWSIALWVHSNNCASQFGL